MLKLKGREAVEKEWQRKKEIAAIIEMALIEDKVRQGERKEARNNAL
jgi:hypothetical protein